MKRFALPALLVAAAFFTFNSTASAHPGHGGGPGHSHGGGYGSYYGPSYGYGGGCNSGYRGYGSYRRSSGYYLQPRSYGNFGHQHHNHGYNSGGLRIRTGNFGFGIRF